MGLYELCSKKVFRINQVVEGMAWMYNSRIDIDCGVIYVLEAVYTFFRVEICCGKFLCMFFFDWKKLSVSLE